VFGRPRSRLGSSAQAFCALGGKSCIMRSAGSQSPPGVFAALEAMILWRAPRYRGPWATEERMTPWHSKWPCKLTETCRGCREAGGGICGGGGGSAATDDRSRLHLCCETIYSARACGRACETPAASDEGVAATRKVHAYPWMWFSEIRGWQVACGSTPATHHPHRGTRMCR